ncbi:helix-turn-helix domain-containing protein, partial [Pseudomonas syringae]
MSAQDIVLSPEESAELSRRTRSATISQRDGRRARVILLAAQGCSRVEIARLVGFSLRSVTLWCKRFQEQGLVGIPRALGHPFHEYLDSDSTLTWTLI